MMESVRRIQWECQMCKMRVSYVYESVGGK